MALSSSFKPTLSLCLKSCNTLSFTDCTQVYNDTTNTKGWASDDGDSANVVGRSDITSASIFLYNSDEELLFTYTVTNQIPTQIGGDINFNDYTYELPDGTYKVIYRIVDSSDKTYQYTYNFTTHCNLKCCISKTVALLPKYLKECNNCKIEEITMLKGLEYALDASVVCEKTAIVAKINKILQRFCDIKCNC